MGKKVSPRNQTAEPAPEETPEAVQEAVASKSTAEQTAELVPTLLPAIFPIPVPKVTVDKLPEKLYFPIEEAAATLNCKATDLLHFGAIEKLTLIIGTPQFLEIVGIHKPQSKDECLPQSDYAITPPNHMPVLFWPEFFILSSEDCKFIETWGEVTQDRFEYAYCLDCMIGNFRQLLPFKSSPKIESRDNFYAWQTMKNGARERIRIRLENLFVTAEDIKKFQDRINNRTNESFPFERDGQENLSPKARDLFQAHLKFWANANPDERDTISKNEEIVKWFMRRESYKDSKTLAEKAATIIRPVWANSGGRPPKIEEV